MTSRRGAIAIGLALAVAGPAAAMRGGQTMFGMIGKMRATPGRRAALAEILTEGTTAMPGCLAYLVAEDAADADVLWITEIWTDQASHATSLTLPAVKAAIAKGRPLIAGFELGAETRPLNAPT